MDKLVPLARPVQMEKLGQLVQMAILDLQDPTDKKDQRVLLDQMDRQD